MPDSLDIAVQQPTSGDAAAYAAHYHRHYYQPAYPNGLTDSLPSAVTEYKPLESYPMVGDRQGNAPVTYTHTPAHSSIMIALLVVAFLLIAYSYKKGAKFFPKLARNLWSVKRTENHLDEHTANENILMVALIIVSLISEGIVIYSAALQWLPTAASMSMPMLVSLSTATATGLYLFQLIAATATGFIFANRIDTRLWLQGFNSAQIFLGLFLTPLALIMLFEPDLNNVMTSVAIGLYAASKLVFYAKSIRIFYSYLFQYVYFISYLCAVEIAPVTFFINRALFI